MMLKVRVYPHYWDQLKKGKTTEFREVEGLEATNTETGEKMTLGVNHMTMAPPSYADAIKKRLKDIPWGKGPIVIINLGERIK